MPEHSLPAPSATTNHPDATTSPLVVDPTLTDQLIQLGRYLHSRQWMPAHTGNFSHRLDHGGYLITADGSNKGALTPSHLVAVDSQGRPQPPNSPKPSLEAPVHQALYQFFPHVNTIIHTHSIAATLLSQMAEETLVLEGYEILKSLQGVKAASDRVSLPVFSNYQDYSQLAIWFRHYAVRFPDKHGFLIRGHGLYTWGDGPAAALRHLEALEFMLECELRMAQMQTPEED